MTTATLTSPPAAPEREAAFSFVLEHPAAHPGAARRHFQAKLSVECDPADVKLDLDRGVSRILVVDARSAKDHAQCRVPGAVSLPHRSIGEESTTHLPRDRTLVVYCWGPGCNAATKAAARLAALGFSVKEMIGGIEYWRREGHACEGDDVENAPLVG
jgi:rhodanese-related sulfurtransferase